MKSLQKLSPNQWYGEQVVGQQTIGKVIKKMMEEADIEGYFTNHSARRTGGHVYFKLGLIRNWLKKPQDTRPMPLINTKLRVMYNIG